jgi:hypothetical protein
MQQSTRRVVILLSSTLLAAGGLLVAACSSDSSSSSSGDLPTVEAGKKDTGTSSSSGDIDSGDLDSGTAADCSTAPKLRSNTNSFYCAFVNKDAGVDGGDGGNPSYCHNNETCCSPGKDNGGNFGDTVCVYDPNKTGDTACAAADPTWAARAGNSVWECADKNNCGASQVCCLYTGQDAGGNVNIGKSTDKNIPAACGALQAFKQGGTVCKASCAAGTEIQMCSSSDDNCGAGTACTPFAGLFRDLGYCK